MELSESNWEAQSDARTLAEADAIRKDEQRLGKATAAAVGLAKKTQAEATSLSKIANQQIFPKSAKALGINDNDQQKT